MSIGALHKKMRQQLRNGQHAFSLHINGAVFRTKTLDKKEQKQQHRMWKRNVGADFFFWLIGA